MSNSKGEFGTDGVVNKDLPQGWTLYPLEEVVEIHNSLRKPINASERSKRDGIYPYYGATGQVGWIDDFRQDGEYVLLGEDGAPFLDITKDKAYIVSGKCWVNNHAHVLKGQKGKCLNKYLLHSLNQTDFRSLVNGTTRLKLTQASLRKIPINLAPLDVQESIVAKIEELFSELDSGVASLKTAQEQLKIYRQSLLKHAFEGKLTEQWRKDNANQLETPEQLLARIQQERETRYQQQLDEWKQAVKDWEAKGKEGKRPSKPNKQLVPFDEITDEELEELPSLPGSFIYTHLSNLGDLGRGKSKHRPRNDPRLFGGKYPFIQTGEVKAAGHKITTFNQTYSEFGLAQSKLWPQGTLCITIAANIAETAFLDFEACFPDSVVGFTAYRLVMPQYIELFIKAVRVQIEAYAPATAQKNINLRTLEGLVVPYCSLAEQQEVVNQLEEKLSIIEQNEQEIDNALAKAELLRQSILKKAFSGQLL